MQHLRCSFMCVETLYPHNYARASLWGFLMCNHFVVLPLAGLNSQLFYTPQSLRDSPPTLVGQLIFFVLIVSGL